MKNYLDIFKTVDSYQNARRRYEDVQAKIAMVAGDFRY